MELWIRSQDKRKLIPIKEELYIPYSRTGEDFEIYYKDNILAHFKKEERALEVLDEIQDQLINYGNVDNLIYEMPKD